MALTDVNRDSVLAAAAEYDQLGQDAFLANYGFRPARKYVLLLKFAMVMMSFPAAGSHPRPVGDPISAENRKRGTGLEDVFAQTCAQTGLWSGAVRARA